MISIHEQFAEIVGRSEELELVFLISVVVVVVVVVVVEKEGNEEEE